jgi:hypothetical protein
MMSATFTIQCWGCSKSVSCLYDSFDDEQQKLQELKNLGWRRRAFWSPNWDKGPWFCSDECATHSHNAQQAAKYWEEHAQKEFEAYCKNAETNRTLLKFGVFFLVFVLAVLTGECIHAGIQ